MSRILLILLIGLFALPVYAQKTEIKKSSDVVVIKGKSYYLHVVDEGQTLFSICKAYGVNLDEVKQLNNKADNAISLFEVLKIPYTEPYVEQDKEFYYHKIKKGETIYSISRIFSIPVRKILKNNPEYENNPLPLDAVLRLPLNDINRSMIGKSYQPETSVKTEVVKNEVPETDKDIRKEVGKQQAEIVTEHKPEKETVTVQKEEQRIVPSYESVSPDNKHVKVALVLPLYAKENLAANVIDTSNHSKKQQGNILHKTENFLYFYEGILMAVDSLKNNGYRVDMHVFDTDKSSNRMLQVTEEINRLHPDLIIGPVYGSEFRVMEENLENKNTPVIYPLSSRSEDFAKYPNFFQVNISSGALVEKMADWIARQSATANVICISMNGGEGHDEQALTDITEKKLFTDKLHSQPGVGFYKWNLQSDQIEALKLILKENKENIIVIPTSREADVSKILPVLSALADHYKITVIGFPDWQNFSSLDHESFYKLNVKLFTYSYVNVYDKAAREFAEKYRRYFYMEPHTLTYKAYDIGLFFIPLVAEYGDRILDVIGNKGQKEAVFSVFRFSDMYPGGGKENKGLYLVNYSSDYEIKVLPLN